MDKSGLLTFDTLLKRQRQISSTNFNDIHANISSNSAYKFAHGLTGTQQGGNAISSNILLGVVGGIFLFALSGRYIRRFYGIVRETIIAEHGNNQKFWEKRHFPLMSQLRQHVKDRPLRRGPKELSLTIGKKISLGNVPTRNQLLFTTFYIILNAILCFMITIKNNHAENVAALRGRSGHLATFNILFATLFAFRNNPFIWSLQISFDSFNYYHRLFARIAIIESLMHVICWVANTEAAGGRYGLHLALISSYSYQWGMVAFIGFMIIFFQAWSPVRRAFYDLFISVHRIFAVLALIGLFLHIYYHHLPQIVWSALTLAFIGAELIIRTIRVYYLNIDFYHGFGTKVTVQALPGASRVTLHLNRRWRPPPGAHVHIYIPSISLVTSHPFSIAWSTGSLSFAKPLTNESRTTEKINGSESSVIEVDNTGNGESITSHAVDGYDITHSDGERLLGPGAVEAQKGTKSGESSGIVCLVMRACNGFTKRIHDKASKSPNGIFTARAIVEGPYGTKPSLRSYGTVLLFAGGVGITHMMPYVYDLTARHAQGQGALQRLRLVWSIPNIENLTWILDWLEQARELPGAEELLRVTLCVSRLKGEGQPKGVPDWIEVKRGRCNVDAEVGDECENRVGAVAVMVCGPSTIAEAVRIASRARMQECSLDLYEETFTY